jgi:hypothetical protein
MHGSRLIAVTSLCVALSGCGTQPLVCTAVFAAITATVVDGAGQPLNGVSVTDTVRRTGAVLDVTGGSPSTSPGAVIIFSDAFLGAVVPAGDEVIVVAGAGGRAGSGNYRFGSDGCHVLKLAGPDTLVVP